MGTLRGLLTGVKRKTGETLFCLYEKVFIR